MAIAEQLSSVLDDLPPAQRAQLRAARRRAADQAAELLSRPVGSVLLVDLETDRLRGARAVEVCAMDLAGTVRYRKRLHPGRLQDPEAVKIHKISDQALLGCPTFEEIASELDGVLSRADVLIAYQADFDQSVLRHEWLRLPGRPLPRPWTRRGNWWCALEAYSRWAMAWDTVEQRYRRIRLGGDHSAKGDTAVLLSRLRLVAGYSETEGEAQTGS